MWYFRIKKCIGSRVCYDRWIDRKLVHYNFYENSIEIKDDTFNIIYDCKIKLFMLIDKEWKSVFQQAFPNEK